jgi:hypothetical protein
MGSQQALKQQKEESKHNESSEGTPKSGAQNISDGYKSRKFWVANSTAFATMSYAMVALPLMWISEDTFVYLMTLSGIEVAFYCGYNIVEKIGILLSLRGKK